MDASSAGFAVDRVSVRFGPTLALDDVTLRVAPGEAVGLVGPSGSGKSTLLRLLNATVRPSSGTVEMGGVDLGWLSRRELKARRASIGFIHQDLSLVPNLRVSQNVVAGRMGQMGFWRSVRALLFPARDDVRRVHALLERVGIPEKLYERTDSLSGGQQQRVAIARALFQDPAALLADEPVSSVDPARARDTVELLTRISAEQRLTLCMSIHNLQLARDHLPRLVGLRGGRILFDKPAAKIGDAEFHALYDLSPDEMLADGT